ncbi:TlpA disulfide reductase family protein [Novosphingobium sp. ZN18A2]|uniref:TlpA family protein disulfide reductase n=1 Tax=Novosphingobium sp. ZN18A2 TaxID=3079861 RepID=UPI0030CD5F52
MQQQSESGPDQVPGASAEQNGTLDISHRGEAMPDFTFADPSGRTLRLTELEGKPVLINLWATWCGPCVVEMPMLDELAGKYAGKLRVVTVSQDMQGAAKVAPFFSSHPFKHLEPWMDPDTNLSFHYNTGLLPTTVLYDAKGKEVWRMIGAHDWAGARTDAMLAETLAGK